MDKLSVYRHYVHMTAPKTAQEYLPLKTDVLLVLLVLQRHELHGYGIIQEVGERSDGAITLQTGALYRLLKRLVADALIESSGRKSAADAEGERRRFYRLTRLGAAVLAAEVERMARLVHVARQARAGKHPRFA